MRCIPVFIFDRHTLQLTAEQILASGQSVTIVVPREYSSALI